jgi:uncharacterized protein (TIGR02246 family)
MKETTNRSHFTPEGWRAITPRIVVHDAKQLVEFLKQVFGTTGEYRRDLPSEIRIDDSVVMISEAGVRSPMTAFLYVYVENTDATYRRALEAGARSLEEPSDMPYGDRRCMVEDRWGNTWQIATHLGGSATVNNDEQEIRQLVATWIEAAKRGDIQAVLNLMTEDVVFLVPGQAPMIGKVAFEAAANAQAMSGDARPQFEGTSEIKEIKVFDDWAYMWTRLKVVITPPDGEPSVTRAGHTLSILRKQAGKWSLARDANMLAPEQSQ